MNLKQIIQIRRFEVMKSRHANKRADPHQERFMADMLMREHQHDEFIMHSKKVADRNHQAIEQHTAALLDLLQKLSERGAA